MRSNCLAQSHAGSWSSDDSPRIILGETFEGNISKERLDHNSEMPRGSESSDDFDDVFSVMIRQRTNGVALYAVLFLSMLMALVSFLLLWQYELPPQQDETTSDYNLLGDVCAPQNYTSAWADLLTKQIEILQNLIHASLLGGSIIVTAYRGDVVWLFFARNCVFYFGLPAISYFVLDVVSREDSERLVITALFCVSCGIAFVKLVGVCRSVRKLQILLFELRAMPPLSLKESVDREQQILPKYLAQTSSDHVKSKIILNSAAAVQIISVVYVLCTTALALSPQLCDESVEADLAHQSAKGVVSHHENTSHLSSFEMAYGIGAHESFLLSLFMLAATFPRCPASVGGAVLSSAWRLLVACCSLIHLLSVGYTTNLRTGLSIFFTTLEILSMIPILRAALHLSKGAGTFRTILGYRVRMWGDDQTGASYSQVTANDLDEEGTCDEDEMSCIDTGVLAEISSHRMAVPTLYLIAASTRFAPLQRFGAGVLWVSSCCLFAGMATENIMLLITSPVGSHASHDIYKWGMHVCAMYLFCVVMNVSSPQVYARARILLCFACPVGSIIGTWQLWVLVSNIANVTSDLSALMAGFLFLFRAMSGLGQCVGLVALADIHPKTRSLEQMDIPTKATALDEDMMLCEAVFKGRFALFKLFLPTFVASTAMSALLGSCFEPMISPSTPCGGMNTFMLSPTWPGLGLSFHFGGLLVIFASDGLTTSTPSYPPSIVVAALFAFHSALLTATHLMFEFTHQESLEHIASFEWQDWLLRATLVGWTVTSFYLCLCLRRVWKLKQPLNF